MIFFEISLQFVLNDLPEQLDPYREKVELYSQEVLIELDLFLQGLLCCRFWQVFLCKTLNFYIFKIHDSRDYSCLF